MHPIIHIQPGHHKRFAHGFPWLYSNEIAQSTFTKEAKAGSLVTLEYQGSLLATGYFNKHSLIAVRALSRCPHQAIDVDFFISRLQAALHQRDRFYSSPFYRLIHAEADGLPGLIIDRFDAVLVVQVNTQGMHALQPYWMEALISLFNPKTIYIKQDSPIRQQEGLAIEEPILWGEPLDTLQVIENDTEFSVELKHSQKTGWFFDHRDNRRLLAGLSNGKTVIDYFCYSGGFSLQAAKQGARHVTGVDASALAIENAKRSAHLNGVEERCTFLVADAFKDMEARVAQQAQYDVVVLDLPAFVKAKKDLNAGLKGYEKLLTRALPLVAPQGLLLIASCSYHVKEADLKAALIRALYKNKQSGRIHKTLSAGFDHPLHPLLEESHYLKGFLVSLEPSF